MALCGHFRSPVTNTPCLWGQHLSTFNCAVSWLWLESASTNTHRCFARGGQVCQRPLPPHCHHRPFSRRPPPTCSMALRGCPFPGVVGLTLGPHGPGPPSRHPRCIMHDPALALSRFFRLGWRGGRCAGGCSAHLRQSRRTWQASSVRQGPDRCSFLKGSFDGRSELAMGIFSLPTSHACYIHFFMLCMVLFKWSFILSLCDENMAST